MKNLKGFTLLEVIVVVALIGILTAIAVPAISQWTPNYRLKGAARDLYSYLQKVKLEAVKNNSCAAVIYTTVADPATGGSYFAFLDDGSGGGTSCDGVKNGGESDLGSRIAILGGVSLTSAANIGATSGVCFNSRGYVSSGQQGNIDLKNAQSRWYRIAVTAAGGLRLQSSSDGNTWSN